MQPKYPDFRRYDLMNKYMKLAADEAKAGICAGHGGPFGCVIVKNGTVIGSGHNEVLKRKDPTCHGEMMAIRDACRRLGSHDLSDCELYTTAEPCPMCAGAILWSNIKIVYYGCSVEDTDGIGFRDKKFYEQGAAVSKQIDRDECMKIFAEYNAIEEKELY